MNETYIDVPGTTPHGPFVTASQPLPTPQPGIDSKIPNLVPDNIKVDQIATRSRSAPTRYSGSLKTVNLRASVGDLRVFII
jgi:hypothetical protein